jgi:hypothetical protein
MVAGAADLTVNEFKGYVAQNVAFAQPGKEKWRLDPFCCAA